MLLFVIGLLLDTASSSTTRALLPSTWLDVFVDFTTMRPTHEDYINRCCISFEALSLWLKEGLYFSGYKEDRGGEGGGITTDFESFEVSEVEVWEKIVATLSSGNRERNTCSADPISPDDRS